MSGTKSWAPKPMARAARGGEAATPLARALKLFAAGALGGTMSLVSLGVLVFPATIECRGTTRALRIDRERQQRCMELGITLAELEALEAAERGGAEQEP